MVDQKAPGSHMRNGPMTDARPPKTPPRVNLSAHEWKLFVVGGLGFAYAATFSIVATQPQPAALQPASAASTTMGSGNSVVWLDQLPVSQRPPVVPPQGWAIAAAAAQRPVGPGSFASATAPSTTPASSAPAPRILTRTS
jgi:hypothetical protein